MLRDPDGYKYGLFPEALAIQKTLPNYKSHPNRAALIFSPSGAILGYRRGGRSLENLLPILLQLVWAASHNSPLSAPVPMYPALSLR